MFSPEYFAKQSAYVESLHSALEVAVSASSELSNDPNARLKICTDCQKPQLFYSNSAPNSPRAIKRHLDFEDSSGAPESPERDRGTYVTAVMSTLLNTRSPNSSYGEMNESARPERQDSPISHKQYFFRRRPSMRAETSRSNASPAKDFRRSLRLQRNTVPLVESPVSSGLAKETYPIVDTSGLHKTADGVGVCDVTPLNDHGAKQEVTAGSTPSVKSASSGIVNTPAETETTRKDCASKRDIYYTLSPLLLNDTTDKESETPKGVFDTPRVNGKDAVSNNDTPCGKPMEGVYEYSEGSKVNEHMESDNCSTVSESSSSATSSSSGRPEYFAVIKKGDPKRKRDKSRDRAMSFGTSFGRRSDSFHNTHEQVMAVLADRTNIPDAGAAKSPQNAGKVVSSSLKADNVTQVANLKVEASRDLTKTPKTPKYFPPDTPSAGYSSHLTTPGHEPGLLSFSNVFEIGDVSNYDVTDSYAEEADFMKDGYCQCSYCNRNEDIFTSTQGKDWAEEAHHHEPSIQCSRHKSRDREFDSPLSREDLASPVPTGKDYKQSPVYRAIMDLFCQCRKQADIDHETLQQDIEKHSTGVASVLNLCEVLLHDGDACATETERQSIEEATKSLDRRWRNICALSMERRLKIEDTQRLWQKFLSDFARFGEWLHDCEMTSANPNTYWVSYDVAREELRLFEAFQRKVHEGLTQLELINKQYRRLARENRTDTSNKLKQLVHDGNTRWDALSRRVSGVLRRLKHAIERRESFEALRESLLVWLTETDLQLTNLEHFSPTSDSDEKISRVKDFQARIEERIPFLQDLDEKGRLLVEKSEEHDCVAVEEELEEFHEYCRDVIARLDRYHRRLLRRMMEADLPPDASLFDDTELCNCTWWTARCLSDASDVSVDSSSGARRDLLATPTGGSNTDEKKKADKRNGRTSPHSIGSLEWDHYDISQSEMETKLDGASFTDDESIPDLPPLDGEEFDELNLSTDSVAKDRFEPKSLKSNLAAVTRPRQDDETAVESAPAKRRRRDLGKADQKERQRERLDHDLEAILAWLGTTKTTLEKSAPVSESLSHIEAKVKELKTLQKEIETRKPTFLSINLLAARIDGGETDDDRSMIDRRKVRSQQMNEEWEAVNASALKRKEELQKMFVRSEELRFATRKLKVWIDEQEKRRKDLAALCRTKDSLLPISLQTLRKAHKSLIQLRVDALEERAKIATLQDISNQLLFADIRFRSHQSPPVDGAAEKADRLNELTDRLKALLDRIGDDVRLAEQALREERGRMRGSLGSNSETDSVASEVSLHSTTSMKLKKLRRKVETAETKFSSDEMTKSRTNHEIATTQQSLSAIETTTTNQIHVAVTTTQVSEVTTTLDAICITGNEKLSPDAATHASRMRSGAADEHGHSDSDGESGYVEYEADYQALCDAIKWAADREESRGAVDYPFDLKRDSVDAADASKAGYLGRAFKYALPLYGIVLAAVLFLLFLPLTCLDDRYVCLRQNNYHYRLNPSLSWTDGPPPT